VYKNRPDSAPLLKAEPEFIFRQNNYWGYHGIYKREGMAYTSWEVRIHDKKDMHLGCFRSPHDAANAYNEYVIEHGLKRKLNKIHGNSRKQA